MRSAEYSVAPCLARWHRSHARLSPSSKTPITDVSSAMLPAYVAAALDVRYHNIASLSLLVWHSLLTLGDEVRYIWALRNRNPYKWVYFFLRYFVILAQSTHNILFEKLANGSNPPVLCTAWFVCLVALSQTLSTLLELILASRVFALYNRSRRVAFLLLILIAAEAIGVARLLWMRHTSSFYGTCLLIQATANHAFQSVLALIVHCALIGLTLFKYFFAYRAGWGRTPLVSLVVRDSSTVYGTIILVLSSMMVMCRVQNERGVVVAFWAMSLISISGCHMILSMERFARRTDSFDSTLDVPLFTSKFSLPTPNSGRTSENRPYDSNVAARLTLRMNGDIS